MGIKWRYFFFPVFFGLLTTGFVMSKESCQQDEAAEISGATGKDLSDFKANMDEVRAYDKKIYGSKDVSAEAAKRMTTRELIMQTTKLDLWLLVTLYPDNPKIAMYRASRCSNSMVELLRRKDFYPAFIQAYSSFNPNPKTNPRFKDEGGLFGTGWMLSLLTDTPLRSQSIGHEKEILSALCKQYREMQKVNASYPKGQEPYPSICFALAPAQQFAKKVFPNARILSVKSEKDVEPGVRELERLCSR
jgi:hypothetical protein